MSVSLSHRAEYWALRGVVGALDTLRWRRATALGARLGTLGYAPFGIRRRVVERQIAAAFPGLDWPDVTRIARGAYEHLGRVTVETALLPSLGRKGVAELVGEVSGWDHVEESLALGRGVILVTGHFGNWELAGAYVASRGIPIDVIVRRMTNPLFDRFINHTRSELGMDVVYDGDAVRRTPRSLKSGRSVGFLVDQGVLNLASTFVPFFGRPAKTPRGPAVFALRWNVPTLFVSARRVPDGRYHMSFEPVTAKRTGDRERDIDAIVEAYTRILERWVRLAPEQYFWHHRRWKWQPPDTPPELREPS